MIFVLFFSYSYGKNEGEISKTTSLQTIKKHLSLKLPLSNNSVKQII